MVEEEKPNWNSMTEKEREDYVNQDYVGRKWNLFVDPDTFDSRCSIGSLYKEHKLDEEALFIPRFSIADVLTDKQLKVLKMILIDGMSMDKVAEVFNISQQAIYNHLRRIRKKLYKIYTKN